MNSTFKVVFNKARGALMVVNEATSSVQAKGTKTVIAAAVAALMAGGAMAGNLTYDSIVNNEGTFKFLNGKGEVTNIKTNADANKLFSDLSAAGTDVDEILKALGQVNESKKTGIVFGYAGGGNVMDTTTHALGKLFKNPCSQAELNKIVPFGFSLQRQKMVFFCHQNSIILLC